MGERQELIGATATITGRLERVPKATWCAAERKRIVNVRIGGIPVTAYNGVAEQLNATKPETILRVEADVTMHKWETGEGKPREQLHLTVTSINECDG